jgi:shikimate 5-dehydrogenase
MRRMYFIGVTTAASSIHALFPQWAKLAGIDGSELVGLDIEPGAPPQAYREAIRRLRDDTAAWGALVTTHKTAVYAHARDLFDGFDGDAEALREVSCIVRREGRMTGVAIDTLTSGLALRQVTGNGPFQGEVLIMGAGGAAVALAVHLSRRHRPSRVILTEVSAGRIVEASELAPAECMLVNVPEDHDRILGTMAEGALIVNATGMGKDRPGCPITAQARFPAWSVAWDFNYRGDLLFLEHARAQGIRAVDGWEYFLHGWSQIMARVFGFGLTPELFTAMRDEAERWRT